MINIQEKKDKILKFLKENGPSLPVRISKVIEMDPVFVSAIASELISSNQVKTSHLKVGSSPLYLIPGQEKELENFSENLKKLEREAFNLLKQNKILSDEEQEPAIRVALRSIKDFAVPFREKDKILWKYAFQKEDEIGPQDTKQQKEIPEVEEVEEKPDEDDEVEEQVFEQIEKIAQEQKQNPIFENEKEEEESVPKAWEMKRQPKRIEEQKEAQKELGSIFDTNEEPEEPEFLKEVKEFLEKNKIEFLEEIRTEKKEIMARVRITSQLGEINMLLIAKNKKTVTKDEIKSSIQMSTKSEMPCLLLIRKDPSKSIENTIENNYLIKILVME